MGDTDQKKKKIKIRLVQYDYEDPSVDNSRVDMFDNVKPEELEDVIDDDDWTQFMAGVDSYYHRGFSFIPALFCCGVCCCLCTCCQNWCIVIPLCCLCNRRENKISRNKLRNLNAFLIQQSDDNPIFKDNNIIVRAKQNVVTHEAQIELTLGDGSTKKDFDGEDEESSDGHQPGSDEGPSGIRDSGDRDEVNRGSSPEGNASGGGLDDIDGDVASSTSSSSSAGGEDLDGLD